MARAFALRQLRVAKDSDTREADYVQTWRRAANPAAGTGDMLRTTYDVDTDGFVDEVKLISSALPTAGVAYAGRFHYVAGTVGTPGYLYFCAANSAGGYEWIVVAQST